MYKLLILLSMCLTLVAAKHEQYDGYGLYQVMVTSDEQAQKVFLLEYKMDVDMLSYATTTRPGLVLVPGPIREQFQDELFALGARYEIQANNVVEILEQEERLLATAAQRSNKTSGRISFDTIHRYAEVYAYLDELGDKYPTVSVESAGKSFEGRDMKYLKISTTNFQDTSKPVIMLQAMLHAREWITTPAALYAIEKLVVDITDQDLVDKIDWIILPIANPDGYEFSHNNGRFWRKNRSTGHFPGDSCLGVDLNRNFEVNWGQWSISAPCSLLFHGPSPFSEPETAAIRDLMLEHVSRLELFIDIHSYGSLILYGYADGQLPSNALTLNVVGVRMATAIDAVKWESKPNYIVGNSALVLYPASGVCPDYAKAIGVPLSYTYELPAYSGFPPISGFFVEPEFIEQAGYETWEGIKAGARFVLDNF